MPTNVNAGPRKFTDTLFGITRLSNSTKRVVAKGIAMSPPIISTNFCLFIAMPGW